MRRGGINSEGRSGPLVREASTFSRLAQPEVARARAEGIRLPARLASLRQAAGYRSCVAASADSALRVLFRVGQMADLNAQACRS